MDAYITDVIVLPEYQGYGIGSILLNDILHYIKLNAFEETRVECTLYLNMRKEGFYKKTGLKNFQMKNMDLE